VQGDEFTDDIAISETQDGFLAVKLEVLRCGADRGKLEDLVVAANFRPPFNYGVRTDSGTRGDGHVFADYSKWGDLDAIFDTGRGMNYSGWMNHLRDNPNGKRKWL
jgi:hypothetical protein